MPLARSIARSYRAHAHQEDVEQVAYLGLAKAAARFDPERGNAFGSYAVPTIHGEIKNFFRDHSWALHVPRLLQERALKAQRVSEELEAELERRPRLDEVADRLGVEAEAAAEALEAATARDAHSLNGAATHGDPDASPLALLEKVGREDENIIRAVDRNLLRSALAILSREERQAIGLRFLADLTQSEVATRIGVSQMHVSRMLRRALERISQQSESQAA